MGAVLEVGTDTGLAITGIAGPDGGTPTKPVGLVYIACCVNDKIQTEEYHFTGTRKASSGRGSVCRFELT